MLLSQQQLNHLIFSQSSTNIYVADTSHRAIREAVRNELIEGVTLDRKFFNVKSRKTYRCACDICARAKMHQISFPPVRD